MNGKASRIPRWDCERYPSTMLTVNICPSSALLGCSTRGLDALGPGSVESCNDLLRRNSTIASFISPISASIPPQKLQRLA